MSSATQTQNDYVIADLSLSDFGRKKLRLLKLKCLA